MSRSAALIRARNLALERAREAATTRHTETVRIGPVEDATDPETGDSTRVMVAVTYEGRGRVKYPSMVVTPGAEPAQVTVEQQIILSLPSGTVIPEGEEVVVLASEVDESLVGGEYVVAGKPQKGQTSAARYPVKELS